jgi:hypothetical protein
LETGSSWGTSFLKAPISSYPEKAFPDENIQLAGHRFRHALIPYVLEPDENAKPNRNWARLIQKIYEVDPLTCPQCQGLMRIISIIEDQEVINKILLHLALWQTNQRPPPKPKSLEIQIDYSDSQLPFYDEVFDQDFQASADHSTV